MPLPETVREIYRRNPLAEVTAQLQFPPILRIEAEAPAAFQEAIRENYPNYQRVLATGQLPSGIPDPVKNLIQSMGAAVGPTQHVFETQDRRSGVTLTRDHLNLRTTAYTKWEDFRTQLERLRTAFEQTYLPAYYSRIGLRYVNVIRRSSIGLGDIEWGLLLNPAVGGELTAEEFSEGIDSASRQLHSKLDGVDSFVTLRTGIALAEPTTPGATREKCFLIDSDFHTHNQTDKTNVKNTLDSFNRVSGDLFRWAIRPRLRDALEPQPLE